MSSFTSNGPTSIDPQSLRAWYHDTAEIAVLDLREEEEFSQGNIFFASCLPLSRLELLLADKLPRRQTRIVVVEAPAGDLQRGAAKLEALGYLDVSTLAGGIDGWREAGLPVYTGVHVPSKAFAEVVEVKLHTPAIEVEDLSARQARGENLVVIDSRTTEEFVRNTVPGAVGVPGADLVRHVRDLAPDPKTTIVVNCGGRTRSIIGAQALLNAGAPNPVVSLSGGLLAWRLAGLTPETGAGRIPVRPSSSAGEWARGASDHLAERFGLRRIRESDLAAFHTDPDRTTYLFDVRRPEDYVQGHLPGALSVQGGQLVQETDSHVVVHGARVVLADDGDLSRAHITASWLVQLGVSDVYVLETGLGDGALENGDHRPHILGLQAAILDGEAAVTPVALNEKLTAGGVTVIDIGLAAAYRSGHVPNAYLGRRTELSAHLASVAGGNEIVLTSEDGTLARLAAFELRDVGSGSIRWLAGGTSGWKNAGLALATGEEKLIGSGGTDVWLTPTQRPDPAAAARKYLDWELGLPTQVAADPDIRFAIVPLGATLRQAS